MAERVIQKSLAGRQDILFGHGQVNQTRAGGLYPINKVSMVWACETCAELLTLDTTQFTQATVNYQGAITHWGWTGSHWYCQETDMTLVGSFEVGFTYTAANQVGCTTSDIYSWGGNLPHVVAPGTDPSTIGSGYVLRTDVVLRNELASGGGAELVFHKSPIANAVAQSLADILNLQSITPEMFGADGTANGDTAALQAALAFARLTPCKIELSRMYDVNQPLVCYYVQTHNTAISIVGKHRGAGLRVVADIPYALDLHGYRINVENVRMLWAAIMPSTTTALRVCGEKAIVSGVTGRGQFGKLVLAVAALRSVFSNIMLNGGDVNHGVAVQLMSCVNCCVTDCTVTDCYSPVVFGGLPYSPETAESLKPPSFSQTITWSNEGLSLLGLKSVATKIGIVLSGLEISAAYCVVDLTVEKPLFVGGIFVKVSHCWFQPNSSFSLFDAIGYTASMGHLSIDNCTLAGTASASVNYNVVADYLQFTNNVVYKAQANIAGGGDRFLSGNIEGADGVLNKSAPSTGNVDIMVGNKKSIMSLGLILGKDTPDGDGKLQIRANSGERLLNGLTASGTVISTCPGGVAATPTAPASDSILYLGKINYSGRSISAMGTINASGADYAEYMRKADGCGAIAKGQIVGVTASAEITDKFDDAVAFAIKSTDPSIVGGDTWGKDVAYPELSVSEPQKQPAPMRKYGQSDADFNAEAVAIEEGYKSELAAYNSRIADYEQALAEYTATIESIRERYDRIAFSGQVPCNAVGGKPGDYVVPARNADGSISCKLVASPSFDEYRIAVGQVWKVMDDGRAWVSVKIA